MDIFKITSLIGFILSTYLTVAKILDSRVKVTIDVLDIYKFKDIVYLKFVLNNLSVNNIAVTTAILSNRSKKQNAVSRTAPKLIFDIKNKTNGVVNNIDKLYSDKIPINIPPKSALSYFLAFPIEPSNIEDLCDGKLTLNLMINGKYYSKEFSFIEKSCPKEKMKKELGR